MTPTTPPAEEFVNPNDVRTSHAYCLHVLASMTHAYLKAHAVLDANRQASGTIAEYLDASTSMLVAAKKNHDLLFGEPDETASLPDFLVMPRATDEQIDAFMDATALVPALVVDSVVCELLGLLDPTLRTGQLYEKLRGREIVDYVIDCTVDVFERNAVLRAAFVSEGDTRPLYYSLVRGWLLKVVEARFPAVHAAIPAEFAKGAYRL